MAARDGQPRAKIVPERYFEFAAGFCQAEETVAAISRPVSLRSRCRLSSSQIAFLDDALVRLAHALDAVLRLAAVVRKRADDLELAIGRCTQRAADEAHGLAGAKLMTHVYLTFGTWNR